MKLAKIVPSVGLVLTVLSLILTACAGNIVGKTERTGASVYAMNYSAKEVEYIAVEAPDNPQNGGGGESLNPYSAGGQVCCFGIPARWTPDLKVVVVYQLAGDKDVRRVLTSVPPYPDGVAGDIWLMVRADESAEAVVSHGDPTTAHWPGTVKGYPVASREYRLKLWSKKINSLEEDIASLSIPLHRSPTFLADQWDFQKHVTPESKKALESFTGPDDPRFFEYLIQKQNFYLERTKRALEHIKGARP